MAMASPSVLFLVTFALLLLNLTPSMTANNVLFNYMETHEALYSGYQLTNGRYSLAMQTDCNLALYEDGTRVMWQSHTTRINEACHLRVETNGLIAIYNGKDQRIWSAGRPTYIPKARYALVLGPDGSLGIYGPAIWSSTGNLETMNRRHDQLAADSQNSILYSSKEPIHVGTTSFPFGEPILVNGDYVLYVSDECNIVVEDAKNQKTKWRTESNYVLGLGSNCMIQMKRDGELFIGDTVIRIGPIVPPRTYRIWGSGVTTKESRYVAALRKDGEIVIYGVHYWVHEAEKNGDGGSTIELVTKP